MKKLYKCCQSLGPRRRMELERRLTFFIKKQVRLEPNKEELYRIACGVFCIHFLLFLLQIMSMRINGLRIELLWGAMKTEITKRSTNNKTTTTLNSGQGNPPSPHLNLNLNYFKNSDFKENFCFRFRTSWPSSHASTLGFSQNYSNDFQKR